jgi:hypothetical protein
VQLGDHEVRGRVVEVGDDQDRTIVVRHCSHWSVSFPESLSGESLLRSPWPVVPVAGFVPEDVPWPGDMVGAPEASKYRAVCVVGSSVTVA